MPVEVVGESADEKLRVNCHHCSATLEYVRADIQKNMVGPIRTWFETDGAFETHYFIYCPRCHVPVAAKR